MGQGRSAHRSGHADVGEKQADVCVCFEKLQRFVGAPRFKHPVTRIREHVGCPHAFKYIVVNDHHERVAVRIGHHAVTITPEFRHAETINSEIRSILNPPIVKIYSGSMRDRNSGQFYTE